MVVPPVDYPKAVTPQAALRNMITAYANRDSVQTSLVYHPEYQGTSTDPSLPGGRVDFTQAAEIRHVGRLKLDPNIVSVTLDLGSEATWVRLSSSDAGHPEWADIQINFQTVRIEDISVNTTWESVNEPLTYTFIPIVAAPGDTTWQIRRWTEFVN